MELLFVGTGSADYEAVFRCDCLNCTGIRTHGARNMRHYASALVGGRILLDCGPTASWRLAELDVPPAQVQAIVVTHSHADHIDARSVTDLLRARPADAAPLPVYGNEPTMAALAALADRLELHVVTPGREVDILGRLFVPIRANHIVEQEETLNWLVETERGWLWYGTDTAWPLPETWDTLRSRPLASAVVEATFGAADPDVHPDCLTHHLNWSEFLRLRQELVAAAVLPAEAPYLATHISQHFAPIHDEFRRQATPPVMLAHDGMRISL